MIYLRFLLPITLLISAFLLHNHFVHAAYLAGKAEISAAWTLSDKVAAAREEAKSAQTRREAAQLESDYDKRYQQAMALATSNSAIIARLRKSLAALTPASPSPGTPPAAPDPGDGERIARILPVLAEGPGLVEEARANYARCAAKLDALQAWSLIAQSATAP